jgi:hypothetical protein
MIGPFEVVWSDRAMKDWLQLTFENAEGWRVRFGVSQNLAKAQRSMSGASIASSSAPTSSRS